MKNIHMPATDMNRSADKTLINWFNFFVLQKQFAAIEAVRLTPFGPIQAPMMEQNLYVNMATHMKGGQA